MGKFKIGDEVVVTEHNADIAEIGSSVTIDLFNLIGTVVSADNGSSYGIAFRRNIGGHNCDGKCEYGYGQFLSEKCLKLLLYKENKTMQKEKHEKKTWEQQIKERFESKRNVLNARIGFAKENSLVPKKFYYDSKTHTTIIDLGETIGKIKTKPIGDDEYDENVTFNILAAKAIYKRFDIPFESDMSSLEAKIFAKYILHKNTGIMFDKYVKYLKDTEQTFLDESAQMKEVEKTRKNQKTKNRSRKAKQKAKKQNK